MGKNATITLLVFCLTGSFAVVGSTQADIPTSGLVAYWEGENTAADSIGSHDGALGGGADYAAGNYGQGFRFNGNDEVVSVLHNVDLQPTSITIGAWIQTGSTGTQLIVDKSHGTGNNGWALQTGSGVARFAYGNGDNFSDELVGSTNIADNSFHHVAVTLDDAANEMRMYIDGVEEAASPLTYNGTPTGNTRAVHIGAWWNQTVDTLYTREFVGVIDDVAIYNRALSQSEVVQLMTHSVPEPGGLLVCLGALVGLGIRRRRI